MAKFDPTEEERAAISYLDWSDEALGKFCKYVATLNEEYSKEQEGLKSVSASVAAMTLIGMAHDSNAEELTMKMEGHTIGDTRTGDWIVTVKKVEQ